VTYEYCDNAGSTNGVGVYANVFEFRITADGEGEDAFVVTFGPVEMTDIRSWSDVDGPFFSSRYATYGFPGGVSDVFNLALESWQY